MGGQGDGSLPHELSTHREQCSFRGDRMERVYLEAPMEVILTGLSED